MTEAVKHTPGPWRTFNGIDVFVYDNDREGWGHIADFDMSHDIPSEEQKANARLAAAAPEMLEALDIVVGCLLWNKQDEASIEVMRRVNAVRAKAEGRL